MTDKDIIKALGFCKDNGILAENCDKCAYYKYGALCMDTMFENALDLINRQQAEIEKLNVELVGMRGACNSYKMHYDNAKVEIERLNNNLSAMATTLSNSARQTRADAIKEYKEKLREHAYLDSGITGFQEMVVDLSDIENIADEMVGKVSE
jgi:hypothetical protein